MPLLKDGKAVAQDPWLRVSDDDPLPPETPVIVGAQRWHKERATLCERNAPLGLALASGESPRDFARDLRFFALVLLEVPAFRDGRVFSAARLLRERLRYKGEIRAHGHILRDQLQFLKRCGVDSVDGDERINEESWRDAMAEISLFYQCAGDSASPLMALRRQGSKEKAKA